MTPNQFYPPPSYHRLLSSPFLIVPSPTPLVYTSFSSFRTRWQRCTDCCLGPAAVPIAAESVYVRTRRDCVLRQRACNSTAAIAMVEAQHQTSFSSRDSDGHAVTDISLHHRTVRRSYANYY